MQQADYDPVYQDKVRAGVRTYFFDIKVGKRGKYLILTESKKQPDGYYQKHKVMIFPEDVAKMRDAVNSAFDSLEEGFEPEVAEEEVEESEVEVDNVDEKDDTVQVEF